MKIIVFSLFFAVAFFGFLRYLGAAADVICEESEKMALLSFKNELKDPRNRLSNWAGANCCEWEGVFCDSSSGHVSGLRLGGDGGKLGGSLSSSLLGLKQLSFLNLSGNEFEWIQIPSFIGSIGKLEFLDLSGAGFEGLIPHELGKLLLLKYLNLGDLGLKNRLRVEDIRWLSSLSLLKFLDLGGVNLEKASDWLQVLNNLDSLVDLHLPRCGLRLISSVDSVSLTSLEVLDLSGNHFDSSFPKWFDDLRSLIHLDLSNCGFYNHLPSGLQNMTRLRYLNLSSNHFDSMFPGWFGKFGYLEVLDIGDNFITGELPNDIGNMTSLMSLDLSRNQLNGMLPESIANLCKLREVYLSHNQFLGGLEPLFRCSYRTLQILYLSSNKLSGQLPSDLGKLSKLRELDLLDNQLAGTLPLSIGELNELEYLVISYNSFEGCVYESHFRNLSRLKILWANGNTLYFKPNRTWVPPFQLTGLWLKAWQLGPEFPFWIQHMKNLSYLSLAKTGISDTVPPWFWDQTFNMVLLNLSGNFICGSIPSLSNFGYARGVAVDLKCNNFSGPLPAIVSNIKILDLSKNHLTESMHDFVCNNVDRDNELEILNLAFNQLFGEIPDCWMNWPRLRVLRVDSNYNLSGYIPRSIGFLTGLESLHLRRNNLSGTLPSFLQNLTGLKVLDLGRNRFTSQIPVWINKLSQLIVFNLRYNEFSGEIPTEICHLNSLQALDLASNNLSGGIPKCFDNFSVMAGKQTPTENIYYSVDDMFGIIPDSQFLVIKGRFAEYSTNLQWMMTLDLSDNSLNGMIPVEITKLVTLKALNLSRNSLTDAIPPSIGDMGWLESIDFSQNQLSGEIPNSISRLSFLSYLNISYNNLAGEIPLSSQLQGLPASGFIGNRLCGRPLPVTCPDKVRSRTEDEDEKHESFLPRVGYGVFVSTALGYILGFWSVLAPLLLDISWRTSYFTVMSVMGNYVYYAWFKLWGR